MLPSWEWFDVRGGVVTFDWRSAALSLSHAKYVVIPVERQISPIYSIVRNFKENLLHE